MDAMPCRPNGLSVPGAHLVLLLRLCARRKKLSLGSSNKESSPSRQGSICSHATNEEKAFIKPSSPVRTPKIGSSGRSSRPRLSLRELENCQGYDREAWPATCEDADPYEPARFSRKPSLRGDLRSIYDGFMMILEVYRESSMLDDAVKTYQEASLHVELIGLRPGREVYDGCKQALGPSHPYTWPRNA